MAYTLMTIGRGGLDGSSFRFSLETATYQALRRTHSWIWGEQQRIAGDTALQFGGRAAEELGFTGLIFPETARQLRALDPLKAMADAGDPVVLTSGTGDVWGAYAIVSLSEKQSHFLPNGAALRIEFDLSLKRYGDRL